MYKLSLFGDKIRFEPGGFPWHSYILDPYRIALCCMEHETLDDFVNKYGPEIIDIYTHAKADIRTVYVKRMRHGDFKCQAVDGSERFYYVDSTTGISYLVYPFPWRRDEVYNEYQNPLAYPGCSWDRASMYFAAPRTGAPLMQWCWKCKNFFTLADSFILLGVDYRHPIVVPRYNQNTMYPHRCTFVTCPFCFACNPKCDEERVQANEHIILNVLDNKGYWTEEKKTVQLTQIRERVDAALSCRQQKGQSYEDCVNNLPVDQWKKDVLLGRYKTNTSLNPTSNATDMW